MSDELRGIADYLAGKLTEEIGHDALIPLDEIGQFAYVDTEIQKVFLITIQEARFVPVSNTESKP